MLFQRLHRISFINTKHYQFNFQRFNGSTIDIHQCIRTPLSIVTTSSQHKLIVKVIKRHNGNESNNSKNNSSEFEPPPSYFSRIYSGTQSIIGSMKDSYLELLGMKKQSFLRRRVDQAVSTRTAEYGDHVPSDYDGPTEIIMVKDQGSQWDQMKARLQNSPIIQQILKGTNVVAKAVGDTSIGKVVKDGSQVVKDKVEDIREIWETSQNPMIYALSNAWESVTGETEEAMAIKQIQRLDPLFVKEDWLEEARRTISPQLIKAHLLGDIRQFKEWTGEGVYRKLTEDIKARKTSGIVFDTNILDFDELDVKIKLLEGQSSPIVVVTYMAQQINCIRNKDGEIIEVS